MNNLIITLALALKDSIVRKTETTIVTSDYLTKKLRDLRPGESLIYFVGYLDSERLYNPGSQNARVSDVAYDLCKEGKVCLTQCRVGPPISNGGMIDWKNGLGGGFKYIATGRQPKVKRSPFFLNPAMSE